MEQTKSAERANSRFSISSIMGFDGNVGKCCKEASMDSRQNANGEFTQLYLYSFAITIRPNNSKSTNLRKGSSV